METSKMISFSLKKERPLRKYFPAPMGKMFSSKFVLEAKGKISTFKNMSNIGLCRN